MKRLAEQIRWVGLVLMTLAGTVIGAVILRVALNAYDLIKGDVYMKVVARRGDDISMLESWWRMLGELWPVVAVIAFSGVLTVAMMAGFICAMVRRPELIALPIHEKAPGMRPGAS